MGGYGSPQYSANAFKVRFVWSAETFDDGPRKFGESGQRAANRFSGPFRTQSVGDDTASSLLAP